MRNRIKSERSSEEYKNSISNNLSYVLQSIGFSTGSPSLVRANSISLNKSSSLGGRKPTLRLNTKLETPFK